MMQGQAPGCFCEHCRREAAERGIDVERVKPAFMQVWDFFQRAKAGETFVDGTFMEFLRVILRNPEVLVWERMWLERSKDLDKELYGIVKWCNPALSFGLNVWNRNHFNPDPQGAVVLGGADRICGLGEADHLPAPGRRGVRQGNGLLCEHHPARLRQEGVCAGDVRASWA